MQERDLAKVSQFSSKELEEARKAVYEKNKTISNMFNEENRLKAEIEKRDREIHQLKKGGATERPNQEVVDPVEQA